MILEMTTGRNIMSKKAIFLFLTVFAAFSFLSCENDYGIKSAFDFVNGDEDAGDYKKFINDEFQTLETPSVKFSKSSYSSYADIEIQNSNSDYNYILWYSDSSSDASNMASQEKLYKYSSGKFGASCTKGYYAVRANKKEKFSPLSKVWHYNGTSWTEL